MGKKICLSITGYHPESWRPAWGIRTALTAIISFMLTPGEGSVGAVEWSEEARRISAKESLDWSCSVCGIHNRTVLPSESEVPSQVLKGEQELTLTLPKAEQQQQGPTSSSFVSKESATDIDTAEIDSAHDADTADTTVAVAVAGGKVGDSAAAAKVGDSAAGNTAAAKVEDIAHPTASANFKSLPTTNEPEPGISAPTLPPPSATTLPSTLSPAHGQQQPNPPSPLLPSSSKPLLTRQQSQHHDLVWKLDSLILLIIGIIIAWIGYRYLEK